jgi:flagellar biosynthesis protein FlhF
MMTPQVFRGPTLDDAQRAAREALGDSAVILTARKVQRRGLRGLFGGMDIEVAAMIHAASPPPPPPPPRPMRDVDAAPISPRPFATSAYAAEPLRPRPSAPPPPPAPKPSDTVISARQEIKAMQNLVARVAPPPQANIETEIAALRDAVDRLSEPTLPRSGALAKALRESGLEGKAAAELAKNVKLAGAGAGTDALRDALADMVSCTPWPLVEQGPALIALVGPSGVGKTTTAAKLAARAMHEMHKSVTFVTCDGVRVGAFEQIDRYADLLGARIVTARSPAELQRAVDSAETDLVIVDTAGRSPTRLDSPERALRALPGPRGGRTRIVLLALPASVRADDAARFAREFALTRPTAMAVTKLDETVVPAGLVHGAFAAKLPISVLCFGQNVPDDIAPATTGAILDYLLPKGARRRMS